MVHQDVCQFALSHFEVDNQIEWTQTYLHHNNDNTNDEE